MRILCFKYFPVTEWICHPCVIFYKVFPASAAVFKIGLIVFIVETSQELKVFVKKSGFMMAEIPWAVVWSVACHKAVIL